jgi:hypothetical protein
LTGKAIPWEGEPMARYEYKFVKIELKPGWAVDQPKEDYHRIIEDHAEDEWRLVQIFAPDNSGTGWASYFEMIFERPAAS